MVEKILRRDTRQRRVVLEELMKLSSHPTAAELYELTRRRLPKISLGTVYRNLELLAQTGTIRKLGSVGSEARFDGNATKHHHVRCVCCGRVDDTHELRVEPVQHEHRHLAGYKILGYHLEFDGICPECKPEGGKTTPPSSVLNPEDAGGNRLGATTD